MMTRIIGAILAGAALVGGGVWYYKQKIAYRPVRVRMP